MRRSRLPDGELGFLPRALDALDGLQAARGGRGRDGDVEF